MWHKGRFSLHVTVFAMRVHAGLLNGIEELEYAPPKRRMLQLRVSRHCNITVVQRYLHNVTTRALCPCNSPQGNYDKAEHLAERTVAVMKEALGNNHPCVAQSLIRQAKILMAQV